MGACFGGALPIRAGMRPGRELGSETNIIVGPKGTEPIKGALSKTKEAATIARRNPRLTDWKHFGSVGDKSRVCVIRNISPEQAFRAGLGALRRQKEKV